MKTRLALAAVAAVFTTTLSSPAHAWLFEEHAQIAREAYDGLKDPTARAALSAAWATTQKQLGERVCTGFARAPGVPRKEDKCVDFGTLTALAADHACSPKELQSTITESSWLPDLLVSAGNTAREIAMDTSRSSRLDNWHQSHLDLNRIDTSYLTRASNNNAHFLMSRYPSHTISDSRSERMSQYLRQVTFTDAPHNALSAYLAYHAGALAAAGKAHELAATDAAQADEWRVRGLLAEAFALHFLQDSFSAGHIAGTHGSRAERMGTHDFYCENGLDMSTWSGSEYGAHGDAFMRPNDVLMAAAAVKVSLAHFAGVLAGAIAPPVATDQARSAAGLDICAPEKVSTELAATLAPMLESPEVLMVLERTPEPFRERYEPPRFANEIGAFVRVSTGVRGGLVALGTDDISPVSAPRVRGNLDLGLSLGFAFAGITSQTADGLVYLQVAGSAQSQERDLPDTNASIDKRFAWGGRIRAPFYLFPLDPILYTILVLPASSASYENLMLKAAQGSAYWRVERVHFEGSIAWQIVAGRELAAYRVDSATYGAPGTTDPRRVKSTQLEFPLIEVRSTQLFSGSIGGGVFAQLGVAVDFNDRRLDDGTTAYLGTAYSAFIRLGAEGRYYFYRP